jgi:hypothetical protein
MTDMSDDLPDHVIRKLITPTMNKKPRQYDLIDLFIVSFYNFFTLALGLGLGYLLWGLK